MRAGVEQRRTGSAAYSSGTRQHSTPLVGTTRVPDEKRTDWTALRCVAKNSAVQLTIGVGNAINNASLVPAIRL